ncbi:outer-membrane lipoprotein carrier protein LolA [Pseudovibrio sp. Tun.PSC04-5.I4]|uniref:outer-membrane lipoprotein carrier protein LolA n=1 Tax=Pseudovibrio sp. Tun.PSC04-5.I4 TaxID=1798213 RepID=UPI0008924DFE|nr:outer-membrane lipoprotein carrier protein LolA [Pseudovibrio sp. Tun.PSC04-5.I4]SDR27260.1 Outer membrane lipoprotein-sorting protein [Pseudovibrio sp. Tun.PSC04-5.I4]
MIASPAISFGTIGRSFALAAALFIGSAPLTAGPSAAQTAQPQPVALSNVQAVDAVSKYFNTVRNMHGKFVQFGPTGGRVEGQFFISRPGKVRFYYNKPSTLDIIADGNMVSVKDRKLQTQDIWPLSQTPLRFLLADQIDLKKDANVSEVLVEPDLITITIDDKTRFTSGRLTLIFDARNYKLKQWTVRDAQGYDTSVAIYDVTENGKTNPDLFKIDYIANSRQNRNNN